MQAERKIPAGGRGRSRAGISTKRRKRIEWLKACIRAGRFVKRNIVEFLCLMAVAVSVFSLSAIYYGRWVDKQTANRKMDKSAALRVQEVKKASEGAAAGAIDAGLLGKRPMEPAEAKMLEKYAGLYAKNQDIVGWMSIPGTVIDYPVMQTPEDEGYYLSHDFSKAESKTGCLVMDTDSTVGDGTANMQYTDGTRPSSNLLVHGHTTKTGEMFGDLKLYAEEVYGKAHNIICFDSLYEERRYELIAVFYSQVYRQKDEVFKYYKFYEAKTQAEFDDWYNNIKALSLYDTGVDARLGDEFITLSCCAYHVENGRFVVVGKRVE